MQRRWLVTIIGTTLMACAAPAQVRESVSRHRIASSTSSERKVARTPARKSVPETRDAKEDDEEFEPQDFSGVATTKPKDDPNAKIESAVDVEGIEGTMTEFDVRTPLENRDADFDRCHDQFRGGSGRIVFRIHINANGDVGDVKAHPSKVRSKQLIECYSDVVASTHFSKPHGGYADVKWTTKVGRSRKKRDELYDRNPKLRYDAPSTSSISSGSESKRERRHHHHRSHHRRHKS